MVWRVHIVIKAWQFILIACLGNEGRVDILCLFIRQILELFLHLGVFLFREEINQLSPHLLHEVCTVDSSSVRVHLIDHVRCCQVDSASNHQSLLVLILFDDTFIRGHAREA